MTDAAPWRDRETLQQMYYEDNHSQTDIAEKFGVSQHTISRWMGKHGIAPGKRYDLAAEAARVEYARYYTKQSGYEVWSTRAGYDTDHLFVHRLLAVAVYGFDAVVDSVVHHKNNIKWDNRPGNIEVMVDSKHKRHHGERRYTAGPWRDEDTLRDAYQSATISELADRWGCHPSTIRTWMVRYDIKRRPHGKRPPGEPADKDLTDESNTAGREEINNE